MGTDSQMEVFVQTLLNNGLPAAYTYHNYQHTMYVHDRAIEIAHHLQCSLSELRLLKAAALWHDTGFIHSYNGHEEESCRLAQQHLPAYRFSVTAIAGICGMIMATKIPQRPANKLEEIIADADLEYLGTAQVELQAYNLFLERKSIQPSLTEPEWNTMQIAFLTNHHYFTSFCINQREPDKQNYLRKLINALP